MGVLQTLEIWIGKFVLNKSLGIIVNNAVLMNHPAYTFILLECVHLFSDISYLLSLIKTNYCSLKFVLADSTLFL